MKILHYRWNAPHPGIGTDSLGRVVDNLMAGMTRLGHKPDFFNTHEKTNRHEMSAICNLVDRFNPDDYDIINFHTDIVENIDYFHKKFVRTLHWAVVEPHTVEEMQRNEYTTIGISKACMTLNELWEQGQQDYVYNTVLLSDGNREIIKEGIKNKEDYYVWLGGTDWFQQKGLDTAILIAKFTGVPLRIYGGGRDPGPIEFIKSQLTDRITYHGIVYEEHKKFDILAKARGLLFPGVILDGGPTSVIEALCCGCPVFAFDHSSLPELVRQPIDGRLFTDMRGMVKHISRKPKYDYASISKSAQVRFDPLTAAQQYLNIYQRILDNS